MSKEMWDTSYGGYYDYKYGDVDEWDDYEDIISAFEMSREEQNQIDWAKEDEKEDGDFLKFEYMVELPNEILDVINERTSHLIFREHSFQEFEWMHNNSFKEFDQACMQEISMEMESVDTQRLGYYTAGMAQVGGHSFPHSFVHGYSYNPCTYYTYSYYPSYYYYPATYETPMNSNAYGNGYNHQFPFGNYFGSL